MAELAISERFLSFEKTYDASWKSQKSSTIKFLLLHIVFVRFKTKILNAR